MQKLTLAGIGALAIASAFGINSLLVATPEPAQELHPHAIAAQADPFEAGEPGDSKMDFRVIEISMTEGGGTLAFTPGTVQVKVGERIKFVIKNTGALDHEFKLDSFANIAKHKIAMEKNPEMIHDEPNGTRLEPSKSGEILWTFSKVGTFEFACLIPGHYEAGMHGTVAVR